MEAESISVAETTRRRMPLAAQAPFADVQKAPIGRGMAMCNYNCIVAFFVALCLCISIAALALAVNVFRPPVWLSQEPSSPHGYFYGGALYQGAGTWVVKVNAKLPAPRSDMGAVPVDANIYILGGYDGAGAVMSTVWEFETTFERYNTSKASMPRANYRFASAAIGKKIYTAGGMHELDGSGPTAVAHADVYVYNTVTDAWTTLAPMSFARVDCAAASFGGKLYVFGGYAPEYASTYSSMEAYDPTTNKWMTRAPMPTPRGDLSAITLGSRIVLLGGWNDIATPTSPSTNGKGEFQSATELYNPGGDSWERQANMLVAKGDVAASAYRGSVYAVGGEVWSGSVDAASGYDINAVPTHDTLAFHPDLSPAGTTPVDVSGYDSASAAQGIASLSGGRGVWVPMAPVPAARFRFAAATTEASQALWVFGGTKNAGEVMDNVVAYYDTWHPRVFVHYKS